MNMIDVNSIRKLLRQPHICEMFAERPILDDYRPLKNLQFSRILDLESTNKRIAYHYFDQTRYQGSWLRIHWGQRKLLLSELEFLTSFADPKHPVLYIGAAPGQHIAYLAKLFPNQAFILFDPEDFNVSESCQIKIYKELFTDEHIKHFAKEEVIFISDIFESNAKKMDRFRSVGDWMQSQARWHRQLNPNKSFLKFRLPNTPGKTTYLNGDLYIPPFGRRGMLETRLLVSEGEKIYDHIDYQEAMVYYHAMDKLQCYEHEYQDDNLDACYHCRAEVEILKSYLLAHVDPNLSNDLPKLKATIQNMSIDISNFLSTFLPQKRSLRTLLARDAGYE